MDDKVWDHVDQICIFARMSPQGKARVIRSMQTRQGHNVFMCGDGGNDVGALKQADVGLALLSGYGNTNTTDGDKEKDSSDAGEGSAEDLLNEKTNDSFTKGQRLQTPRLKICSIRSVLSLQRKCRVNGCRKSWLSGRSKVRVELCHTWGLLKMQQLACRGN